MNPESYSGYRGWKGWYASDFGKLDASLARYFAGEILLCGYATLQGQSLLELGFGNGAFSAWAISQGAHYRGTEIIPELILRARQAGVEAFDARSPIESVANANTVDLAIAFDVLEHIEITELRTIMRSLHLCLKPGGILLGRVPSGDSPFARAVQHGDLTHCSSFGSSAIQQLGGLAGFEVVAVREPAFPLFGGGAVAFVRRLLVQAARRMMYPIIVNAFMGGGHPVLTPNLVFVLRKPSGRA